MKTVFKKRFVLSAILLFNLSLGLQSQENYTIKMSIKTEGLPAEMAAYGEQDMVTYMKGDKSKTEVSSMMFSTITYFDGQTVVSLTDAMGNKSGYKATKEELEAAGKPETNEKPKIEYSDEKKMIAGFECRKATVTAKGKDQESSVITVWVTDKIKNNQKVLNKTARRGMADLSDLNGYPLAMEMPMNIQGAPAKVVMTTSEVLTTPIDDAVFTPNTEGYTMMTYKEMREKQKQMMQQGR